MPNAATDPMLRYARSLRPSDAPAAAAWILRNMPVPKPLAEALPDLLQQLVAAETLIGTVVEYARDGEEKPELAAFGLSGFLSDECANAYLEAPTPHFQLALLDKVRRGARGPAFLTYDEIAAANAGDGLTLFPLLWLQRCQNPADPEARALMALGQQCFLSAHRGYRLNRIVKVLPAELVSAHLGGGFREHCRLPAGAPLSFGGASQIDQAVLTVARADVERDWPSTALSHLFVYEPPRCRFTRAEQQVLILAADGLTDAKIAQALGLATGAVSLRWRAIRKRLGDTVRLALAEEEDTPHPTRGPEKRRGVLAFVERHPQEIRPYACRQNGNRRCC